MSVLRLEVQRLNVARQQAEAARAAAEERATASQAVAESLQRDLNNAMAASNGPLAQHARAVVDAENKGLRAQLEVPHLSVMYTESYVVFPDIDGCCMTLDTTEHAIAERSVCTAARG